MEQNRKKKSFLIAWSILLILFLWAAYCISGLCLMEGLTIENYTGYLAEVFRHPFRNYYNSKTYIFLLSGFGIWFFCMIYGYTGLHNLMDGKEYGTARWANLKDINKRLACLVTCTFLIFRYKKPDQHNRIISERVRISYIGENTLLNNNMLVIGGAGAGKTAFFVTPNALQNHGSNVYTDPKGGLVEELGNYLISLGRRVLSLNLCEPSKSCQYNPFKYLRKPSDVSKLITNLIANTTPGNAHTSDPFWEKAERMYLTAIFNYVWMECPRNETIIHENGVREEITLKRNFRSVLHLLDEAAVSDDPDVPSQLDQRMDDLALEKGEHHPAVRSYRRCIRGAGDTVRSIIISANARFDPFDDEEILRILDDDDIDIPSLGVGVNGDGETMTSLFCCIPDDDDTFNFIPGMLYTQMFQELYRQARFYKGKLPIDVGFWFDEFANIKMPNSFDKILATCRSRHIYCVIILQSLAQLKDLYKDNKWEGIVGNTDIIVYLGGNEPSSHKFISEQLSKATIEKRSTGESRGSHGSSSKNYDKLGRELMTTDEVGRLKDRCICLIRGEYPIIDRKWNYFKKKIRKTVRKMGEFDTDIKIKKVGTRYLTEKIENSFTALKPKSMEYYKRCQDSGENVEIYKMDMKTFLSYDFDSAGSEGNFPLNEEVLQAENIKYESVDKELDTQASANRDRQLGKKSSKEQLTDRLIQGAFSLEQMKVIKTALRGGLRVEGILKFARPEVPAEKMELIYEMLMEETEY
ncbi:MAG: type IV secretory system conjugative DNA transfer family protein [Ruminococcus sp.]|nr:type IV secretory system conjugative DNA transfer family protein [Ruminococcus sp.]